MRADAETTGRPAPELEAFIAREFCPNCSSLCYVVHGYDRRAHFCYAHDRQTLRAMPSGEALRELSLLPPGWSDAPDVLAAYTTWHRCGLCAIATLRSLGVGHLKIPGRSGSALAAVQAVRALLDAGDLSEAACRATVASPGFCADGRHCYYDLEDVRSTGRPSASPPLAASPIPSPAPARLSASAPAPAPSLAVSVLPEACTAATLASLRAGGWPALRAALPLAPWERAAAERTLAFLADRGLQVDAAPTRVILDYTPCPLRWPRPVALVAQLRTIIDAGFPVALSLPVAFEAHFDAIAAGLAAVAAAFDLRPTVIVNDLGALALAVALGLPVEAGRVLNRLKRDQFARDPSALPSVAASELVDTPERATVRAAQTTAYGRPYLDRGAHATGLAAAGVRRLAWDALPTPLSAPLSPAFAASLWAPWAHLTTARACPLAIALEDASPAHPTTHCRRGCIDHALTFSYPWPHAPTVRHGATAHMDTSAELPTFFASARGAFDEIVVSLQVPR